MPTGGGRYRNTFCIGLKPNLVDDQNEGQVRWTAQFAILFQDGGHLKL